MENQERISGFWQKSADLDFAAAQDLFKSEKYPHSLFFMHLALEKILKALYVKIRQSYPPRSHNLKYLVGQMDLIIPERLCAYLPEIDSFNIEARYPDEKFEFYQKCTRQFAVKYEKIIRELFGWLKKKL